jgi:UDP-glucose 4-epimerase
MARYVITGGSGFVGRALASAIRAGGDEPVIASRGRHADGGADDWIEYDLKDRATIANIIEARPAGIYHLAWSTTPGSAERDPASDVQTNLAGTVALFQEVSERLNIPLVFLSSGGTVYGPANTLPIPEDHPLNPISIYGMTKAAAETYACSFRLRHRLDARIARLSNPFGSTQSAAKLQGAASIFARKVIIGEPITIWGDGSVVRDYIHVDDAVLGLTAIMKLEREQSSSLPAFNIGSGEGSTLTELIEMIGTAAELTPKVSYSEPRSFDIPTNILDISKITATTGWRPRCGTKASIRMMVAALKASQNLPDAVKGLQ